VDSPG
jgi:hypothetical protein